MVHLPKTGAVLLAVDAVMMERQFTAGRQPWPMDDNADELRASTQKLLALHADLVIFGHDGAQWRSLRKSPEYYE